MDFCSAFVRTIGTRHEEEMYAVIQQGTGFGKLHYFAVGMATDRLLDMHEAVIQEDVEWR